MNIEAELPDGTILEFPDGTPDAVVQAKVREHLGATRTPAPAAHTPATGGPIARLFEPVGQFVKGMASLPGAVGGALLRGDYGQMSRGMGDALIDPSIEQGRQAGAAAGRGDLGEAALRALATLDVGGAGNDVGQSAADGNIAGAIGQAAVNFAPFGKALKPATRAAAALRTRANTRMFRVLNPAKDAVPAVEAVLDDIVHGIDDGKGSRGIGHGSIEDLTIEAEKRRKRAGDLVDVFQNNQTPVRVSPVTRKLRHDAAKLETVPPDRVEWVEVPVLDEAGDPVIGLNGPEMGMHEEVVKGTPVSGYPTKVSALREQADKIDALAAQYPDELVPAGELFKFRSATGQRVAGSFDLAAGEQATAAGEAGKTARKYVSEHLKDEIPAAKLADREYQVFNTAWKHFEEGRRTKLTNRGLQGLKNLLTGRMAAQVLAGAVGGGAVGGVTGSAVGVTGALAGTILGESAYWGSLRASTYSKLSKALNSGDLDQAAAILQRTASVYAVEKGIQDRERNRRAQKALQQQAEGVVGP